jgi:hypothetical protein
MARHIYDASHWGRVGLNNRWRCLGSRLGLQIVKWDDNKTFAIMQPDNHGHLQRCHATRFRTFRTAMIAADQMIRKGA